MSQAAKTAPPAAGLRAAEAAPPAFERPPYLHALGAAAAVFALYAITLGPTTWFWDTSEYIATAHILGIPHPPGNPLFVILARAWELLLSPFGLSPAVRINLFSAFMSAGTSFFWFLVVHRILGWFTDRRGVRLAGAAVSVVIAATAFTVWNQSTVNEKVYTVTLFTIAAMTWIAFLWRDHVEEHAAARAAGGRRWHDDNALLLIAFLLALSVGNHLMAFLAAPAIGLFVLLVKPRALMNWRLYALAALFGVLGLSVHFFLSIRSGLHPIINEAAPSCPSIGSAFLSILGFGNVKLPGACEDLFAALAREQYQKPSVLDRQSPFPSQMTNYFQYFDWQWARSVSGRVGYFGPFRIFVTLLFVALGVHGAVEHFRRDRKSFAYVAALFGVLSVGLVIYMNFRYGYGQAIARGLGLDAAEVRERDYFFLVSFSVWGLWAGIGLVALWMTLAEVLEGNRHRWKLASLVLLPAFIPLALNWSYASRRDDYTARDFAYNMLQSVEPYGVLFTNGDNDTFPLWYLQEVEGIRRDVTVIVLSYLNTPWYARQLRELTSPCQRPGQALEDPTRIVCQRPFQADERVAKLYAGARAPTKSILPLADADIDRITLTPAYPLPQDMVFQARGIQSTLPAGKYLLPADYLLLNIVHEAWGDRPIYFAVTTNAHFELGLERWTERQGLAFKLVNAQDARGASAFPENNEYMPITGGFMSAERNRVLLDSVFMRRGILTKAHWTDDATRNIPKQYVYAYEAAALLESGLGNAEASQRYRAVAQQFNDLSDR